MRALEIGIVDSITTSGKLRRVISKCLPQNNLPQKDSDKNHTQQLLINHLTTPQAHKTHVHIMEEPAKCSISYFQIV